MARRRKKNSLTYDSKEIRTVFGLLFFLFGIILFISTFVEMKPENFLTFLRVQLGITTLVVSFFCFSIGMKFFGIRNPFTHTLSLISQFFLVFLFPAFFASIFRLESQAVRAASAGSAGGQLGYWLAWDLYADKMIFGQLTPIIVGILILIFLPLALSFSISKIVDFIQIVFSWIWRALGQIGAFLFSTGEEVKNMAESKLTQQQEEDVKPGTKRFGDFQRKLDNMEQEDEIQPSPMQEKIAKQHEETARQIEALAEKANVDIKEAEVGEEGLAQSELAYPNWKLPPISLLEPYQKVKHHDSDTDRNAEIIEQTLASFSIDAEVAEAYIGPSVVRYALSIPLGTKVSKIAGLSPTLALGLGVDSNAVRVDTIPGTTFLGIEVPRQKRDSVLIRELIESQQKNGAGINIPMVIGKDIDGKGITIDLQTMPHLLIAGATGSGKSILTNSFIMTMLMNRTPDELRMILVDPKQVELADYNGIPHLLTPVITDMNKVVNALKWAVGEMERRYTTLSHQRVRNIEEYNKKLGFAAMPYIVVVIDEMADMMMTANRVDAENAIVRLTQKARAVGIHLILATQRPSVNVITGLIKANVPARIGMSVASSTDSRVIMDSTGAESLMGKGDLLFNAPGISKLQRLQGSYVSQDEVIRVVEYIKSQVPEVEYITSILEDTSPGSGNPAGGLAAFSEDDEFANAVNIIVNAQKGSASFLQRKLGVGFNRAARLLEEMEELGIVGPSNGSKPRDVLITDANSVLESLKG